MPSYDSSQARPLAGGFQTPGGAVKDPELAARFNKRFRGTKVHRSTILRAMHDLGFSFKKKSVRPAT